MNITPAKTLVRTLLPPFPGATITDSAGTFRVDPVEASQDALGHKGETFLNCLRTQDAQRRYLTIMRAGCAWVYMATWQSHNARPPQRALLTIRRYPCSDTIWTLAECSTTRCRTASRRILAHVCAWLDASNRGIDVATLQAVRSMDTRVRAQLAAPTKPAHPCTPPLPLRFLRQSNATNPRTHALLGALSWDLQASFATGGCSTPNNDEPATPFEDILRLCMARVNLLIICQAIFPYARAVLGHVGVLPAEWRAGDVSPTQIHSLTSTLVGIARAPVWVCKRQPPLTVPTIRALVADYRQEHAVAAVALDQHLLPDADEIAAARRSVAALGALLIVPTFPTP
ncbi:MAG: hypothetical protein WCI73_14485 [Phycisphaerae bacterium]